MKFDALLNNDKEEVTIIELSMCEMDGEEELFFNDSSWLPLQEETNSESVNLIDESLMPLMSETDHCFSDYESSDYSSRY